MALPDAVPTSCSGVWTSVAIAVVVCGLWLAPIGSVRSTLTPSLLQVEVTQPLRQLAAAHQPWVGRQHEATAALELLRNVTVAPEAWDRRCVLDPLVGVSNTTTTVNVTAALHAVGLHNWWPAAGILSEVHNETLYGALVKPLVQCGRQLPVLRTVLCGQGQAAGVADLAAAVVVSRIAHAAAEEVLAATELEMWFVAQEVKRSWGQRASDALALVQAINAMRTGTRPVDGQELRALLQTQLARRIVGSSSSHATIAAGLQLLVALPTQAVEMDVTRRLLWAASPRWLDVFLAWDSTVSSAVRQPPSMQPDVVCAASTQPALVLSMWAYAELIMAASAAEVVAATAGAAQLQSSALLATLSSALLPTAAASDVTTVLNVLDMHSGAVAVDSLTLLGVLSPEQMEFTIAVSMWAFMLASGFGLEALVLTVLAPRVTSNLLAVCARFAGAVSPILLLVAFSTTNVWGAVVATLAIWKGGFGGLVFQHVPCLFKQQSSRGAWVALVGNMAYVSAASWGAILVARGLAAVSVQLYAVLLPLIVQLLVQHVEVWHKAGAVAAAALVEVWWEIEVFAVLQLPQPAHVSVTLWALVASHWCWMLQLLVDGIGEAGLRDGRQLYNSSSAVTPVGAGSSQLPTSTGSTPTTTAAHADREFFEPWE